MPGLPTGNTVSVPPEGATAAITASLIEQSATIAKLSAELVASYEKELAFFGALESRDRAMKDLDNSRLKKIWWLEAELRKERDRSRQLTADLEKLKGTRMVKWQRKLWGARTKLRSWR